MPDTTESTVRRAASGRPRWKRLVVTLLKWLLLAVVLVVVGRAIVVRFEEVSWDEVPFRPGWLGAALAAGLAAAGVTFLPYYLLLEGFGHRPPAPPVMTSVWMAQVGKYLPGKVGSVVGLIWLLRRYGVRVGISAGAVVMVDGLSVILGVLVAVPLTLYDPVQTRVPLAWLWCLILVAAGMVCLHPRIFGGLTNVVLRRLRQATLPRLPRVRDLGWPAAALLGQFLLLGLTLWLLARAVTDVGAADLPLFIACSTLATVGGFLSFFAPAGIGVHEGLLILVLEPLVGGTNAAILAVANRFVKTVAEATLAAAGLALQRFVPSLRPTAAEATATDD
jgi:hypothetical protein